MPQLPSAADFGVRPAVDEQRPVVTDQGGQILAQGVTSAASNAFQADIRHQQAQNRYDLTTGRYKVITAQIAAREALQDDPDFATHEARYRKAMQDATGTIIDQTTNPRIKGELSAYAADETERGALHVRQAAGVKRHETAVATTMDNLETLRQAALKVPDNGSKVAAFSAADGMIQAAVDNGDMNPTAGANTRRLWNQSFAHGTVEMLSDSDQVKVLKNPKGTAAEFLDADHAAQMLHGAQARVDAENHRAMMEARQELAIKMQDAHAAAINGLPIPAGSTPTRAEMKAADPEHWADHWNLLQKDIQYGNDVTALRGASPEQIRDLSSRYVVTQGGPGTHMAIERRDAFERARTQVLKERENDSGKAAIDAGLWKPLNFQDPQQLGQGLSSRIATAPEISRHFGVPVQPLAKGEAEGLASALEHQTPDQQLQSLKALQTAAGSDAGYQQVMAQVMPSSPVVAITGQRVGFNDPARRPVWFDSAHAPSAADASIILTGERLLNPQGPEKAGREAGAKAPPMPAAEQASTGLGLRDQFAANAKDAFRDRPELGDAYYAAYRAAYAGLAAKDGDRSGKYDSARSKKAFEMAVGQIHQVGTSSVVVPPGMDDSRFQQHLDIAIAARAKAQGAPEGFEKNIAGYSLREIGGVGSGRYQLVNGNTVFQRPDNPRVPFEIDLRAQFDPTRGAVGGAGDRARAAADAAAAKQGQP